MPAESEIGRVTLSTPNRKLSYGVEARKTVLPCRHFYFQKKIGLKFNPYTQKAS